MKTKILLLSILILLTSAITPLFTTLASKENPSEHCNSTENPTNSPCIQPYTLLAPLPGLDNKEPFYPSDQGALGNYINLIIKLVIGISAVLAVVMIVLGGIEYMGSELISEKADGKSKINNAILGLLIALGAYALLNTINPDLLNSDIKIDDATVVVNIDDSVPQTPVNGKYKNGVAHGTPLTGTPTPLPIGVALNNGWSQCTYVGQTACTSTIGLNMDGVWAVKNGCNCNLTITGGTEWWAHGASGSTTHQVGNGTVDLRVTNELTKYFTGSTATPQKKWYKTPSGFALYEGDHWHFNPSGPH